MPRYSKKQKVALDALMRDDVHRHAVEIIEAEGIRGLTLDRLASRIGVSRATLYNYFADRRAIVDFVEERTVAPVLEAIETIVEREGKAAAKLEAIASAILSAVRDNRALVVALSPEKFGDRDKRAQLRRRHRALEFIRKVIEEGIEAGEFRALPSTLVSEVFLGAIAGLIDGMALSGEFRKPETIVPTLMTVFLGGLRSGKGGHR